MTEWNAGEESPRVKAVKGLLTSLEQNDAAYLDGSMDRERYSEVLRDIDNRLAVAGLRLAVRPWERK
jgi:hypothetical protein